MYLAVLNGLWNIRNVDVGFSSKTIYYYVNVPSITSYKFLLFNYFITMQSVLAEIVVYIIYIVHTTC